MQLSVMFYSFLLGIQFVYATPSDQDTRQIIPFNIALLNTNFCTERYSTSFPNNGTACQVLSQPAVGAFATTSLPSGCTILAYPNPTCTGTTFISVPRDTSCFSFGNKQKITSWKVSGTCPWFQS
ncbi:hypothetical protein HBH56_096570 [Parastagonospora nodorum]|uniref:Uncharacterized protein n=1 Tax=Phaeosphaeria nodorum (strain SN15 / ATCC MYA-4574 / FGSC 10173) TaxID=321614 RepID=A0A7U2ICC8_PHANO|nr:hypothetical protein HBH56_096570 [Parastagonospora nodorum]QRD07252.1 hypothetical protein JI435_447130 [Parastagonospora nodorum SN15]KAH3930535.1 hypothetical protein HBH54_110890 [Parastagonospora nodorum]KAH3966890.1 hypothetical protein HBH51_139960 [Parastagonospora nodorum]KAH4118494.1 hypothetical protein HBH47_140500 [Parastagonospora nodorum]